MSGTTDARENCLSMPGLRQCLAPAWQPCRPLMLPAASAVPICGVAGEILPKVWFSKSVAGRAPEPWEVERVVDSLGRHGTLDRVTVDLSQLEVINSSFLAALVGMKKRLQPFGCTLFLRGLRPIVCEIFDRLRLNGYFAL